MQRAVGGNAPSVEDLPPGVVARVGSDDISSRGVGQVAAAQRITREQALDRMVADALFAAEARDRFPATVAAAERGAAARALLEELQRAARAAGPPTDTEVQQVTERRWWDLDRPPSVKVTHAVVRVKKPVDDSAARELAERIAKATVGAESAADFEKRATAVPANGLTVLVEHLPPVTEDGRVVPRSLHRRTSRRDASKSRSRGLPTPSRTWGSRAAWCRRPTATT